MNEDTTYTVDDLVKMTLEELGVQEPGQPVAAEDREAVLSRWPSVLVDLNARDVGFFDGTDIEAGALLPLAQIMAYACRNAFNIADAAKSAELFQVGGKEGEAEKTLRNFRRLRNTRQTMRQDVFTRYRWWRYGF